jgi:beta-galactosidase
LYHVLRGAYRRYGVDIIVMENGVADARDGIRPAFIVSHLNQVHRAMSEGVEVKGYLHWSLIDNYE